MLIVLAESDLSNQPPFSERITVALVGPLVSTVLGTIIFGLVLWLLSNRATARRAKDERNRDNMKTKHELLAEIAEAHAALYLATQVYWRKKRDNFPDQDAAEARKTLDEQYRDARKAGSVIEAKLQSYFDSDQPRELWHKIDDLLTVRYFQLIDRDTPGLIKANSKKDNGQQHSGLTESELKDPSNKVKNVLDAYHKARRGIPELILTSTLREPTPSK